MINIKGNAIKIYSGKLRKDFYIVQDEEDRQMFAKKFHPRAIIYTLAEIQHMLAIKDIFPQAKVEEAAWQQFHTS